MVVAAPSVIQKHLDDLRNVKWVHSYYAGIYSGKKDRAFYVHTIMYVHVCACMCVYDSAHVCVCVCVCTCVCVCMCVCVCENSQYGDNKLNNLIYIQCVV